MTSPATLAVFSGYGIELEWMIVDSQSLAVRPIAHQLLRAMAGRDTSDVDRGPLGWSNELVLHLIELKNTKPTPALDALPSAFQEEVRSVNRTLAAFGCRLMPTGMHPWMNPRAETLLWPSGDAEIYATFDRIFNCRSHGWANLQSMHINLPFSEDLQFARLHAAIRLVLPLLPALAASSPIADGTNTGFMDYRLEVYRLNASPVPSVTGQIIPEAVDSRADYEANILAPMYREIAPHDPAGVLRHEWLNSRGAIARFDRNAIEIRLADTQECPHANIAIACAMVAVVKALYSERWARLDGHGMATESLAGILLACIRDADQAIIDAPELLQSLGWRERRCRAGELWAHLVEATVSEEVCRDARLRDALRVILENGPLARRILRAMAGDYSQSRLHEVYARLCECLEEGQMFVVA